MEQQFIVEVNNLPEEVHEWVVARFNPTTRDLWYWGSYPKENQAKEIAKLIDGLVVRKINGADREETD